MEVTKIIYKPHCGKCGFPIDTNECEIAYQEIYENCSEAMLARKVGANIYPYKCPHCGTLFDSIEITPPKKFQDTYIK